MIIMIVIVRLRGVRVGGGGGKRSALAEPPKGMPYATRVVIYMFIETFTYIYIYIYI